MAVNVKNLPHHFYTLEEYFALERAGQARYEYWNGEIICMNGGTRNYSTIIGNVYFSLRSQLTGYGCRAFTSHLPIKTPSLPPYRYPNVSVVCGTPAFENIEATDALTNPTLIVEVLSPGTESLDRKEKRLAYQALASLMEYVLIAQDAPHITHFVRKGDIWVRSDYADTTASVSLPSVGCSLAFSDVYSEVEFE
jgi:Uma2 family endonuclease